MSASVIRSRGRECPSTGSCNNAALGIRGMAGLMNFGVPEQESVEWSVPFLPAERVIPKLSAL
jgi:hypothetical protein